VPFRFPPFLEAAEAPAPPLFRFPPREPRPAGGLSAAGLLRSGALRAGVREAALRLAAAPERSPSHRLMPPLRGRIPSDEVGGPRPEP
jgi:hypothetical protein